jgi:hypothetical protein
MTAVEWLRQELLKRDMDISIKDLFEEAKEMEQTNTDNKVIHFAEWLTKKHTYTLITLYEHFEEEHYGNK